MKLPTFKKSDTFWDDSYSAKCMVAHINHSTIPTVGARHLKKYGKEEVEVVLVGKKDWTITPWHRSVLARLFTKEELVQGVEAGIKAIEKSRRFDGYDEMALEYIDADGFLPWVYVRLIVIDDTRKTICIQLGTIIDSNFDEHGIELFWQKNRWFWGEDDRKVEHFLESFVE